MAKMRAVVREPFFLHKWIFIRPNTYGVHAMFQSIKNELAESPLAYFLICVLTNLLLHLIQSYRKPLFLFPNCSIALRANTSSAKGSITPQSEGICSLLEGDHFSLRISSHGA